MRVDDAAGNICDGTTAGRNGQARCRFTHKGIVYITDESCRHEVTSWKLDDSDPADHPAALFPGGGPATRTLSL
jgi:hypothetical protein